MNGWNALAALRGGIPVLAPGHVWLAGAGPGDPGLLTLDALAGLSQADVIVHDALVDKRVLALAGAQARLEFAGKRGGKPSATQADISQRLVELAACRPEGAAAQGRRSVRVRTRRRGGLGAGGGGRAVPRDSGRDRGARRAGGGVDPRHLARRQPRGHLRGRPCGRGRRSTGRRSRAPAQPIVLYMVMHNLERIADALMRGGLAPRTPAAVIAAATTADERILVSTLERVAADAREQAFAAAGDRGRSATSWRCASGCSGSPQRRTRCRDDRARPHRRRARVGLRQDHRHARAAGGAGAARHRGAGGKGRPGLHRSRVPRRRHRRAELQSRQLGDAAAAARRARRRGGAAAPSCS